MQKETHRCSRCVALNTYKNGKSNNIRCDNGPEFASHIFQDWSKDKSINIHQTQPRRPTQSKHIERFNESYRRTVLNAYIFRTFDKARKQTDKWNNYYNNERLRDALRDIPSMRYRLAPKKTDLYTSILKNG